MVPRSLVVAIALMVSSLAMAGCIGPKAEPKDDTLDESATNESGGNTTLPDGRGESLGNLETNKTEEGSGGIDHKHDYWKGREQVVVFEDIVGFFPEPVYPDGEGSDPKSVAYVKLPNTTLVYEGTNKLSVVASNPTLFDQADPQAPALFLQYRSAADADWRDPVSMPYDTPLDFAVLPKETDMPHSTLSLWVFRITTDRPTWSDFELTITAHKGQDVVDWPGHPDFYADKNERKVADNKHVSTHMSGMAEGYLYDAGSSWAQPDKLISYGTSKLVVIINITNAQSQFGAAATGFFLEVHDATIIGPEIRFGDRYFERDDANDLRTYVFEVPVDPAGMDGPYQPASRWGFRAMATFADIDAAGLGLCPGCFSYDIEYDLTVIAIHEEGAAGIKE